MSRLHVVMMIALASIAYGQDMSAKFEAELASQANENKVATLIKSTVKMKLETEGRAEALQLLQQVQMEYKGKKAEAASICLSIPLLRQTDSVNAAVELCDKVVKEYKGTYWAEECLYNLYEIYLDDLNNSETAQKYLKQLKDDYPNSKLWN